MKIHYPDGQLEDTGATTELVAGGNYGVRSDDGGEQLYANNMAHDNELQCIFLNDQSHDDVVLQCLDRLWISPLRPGEQEQPANLADSGFGKGFYPCLITTYPQAIPVKDNSGKGRVENITAVPIFRRRRAGYLVL